MLPEEGLKLVKKYEKKGYKSDLYSDGWYDGYAQCMKDIRTILRNNHTFEISKFAEKCINKKK